MCKASFTYLVTSLHQSANVDANSLCGEGGGQELASLITANVEHLQRVCFELPQCSYETPSVLKQALHEPLQSRT